MLNQFNLAYLQIFIFLVLALFLVGYYRWFIWQPLRYKTAVTDFLVNRLAFKKRHKLDYVVYGLRFIALFLIVLAIGRPQIVDPKSAVRVEGVDIALVLDVSYSMLLFDDLKDQRTRIEIAKAEAIKFVERRESDPIGLVLFGRYAVSRCPLTLDKDILRQIIAKIEIGEIDPGGTGLSIAMLTAANRLKNSKAKSRIMIVLTDGQPSPDDLNPQIVIDIAKKLDVKIYTIGIGSIDGGYLRHPIHGIIKHGELFNSELLTKFAEQTGGRFFQAKDAGDLNQIYHQIDQLEKTSYETAVFTKRAELFKWCLLGAISILLFEVGLSFFGGVGI